MKWPDEALKEISSGEDLARFLVELSGQVKSKGTPVENSTVEGFLEAVGHWAGSMEGFFDNISKEPVPENPDGAMVAAIFRAALVYE